jgi:hypothetical protein
MVTGSRNTVSRQVYAGSGEKFKAWNGKSWGGNPEGCRKGLHIGKNACLHTEAASEDA